MANKERFKVGRLVAALISPAPASPATALALLPLGTNGEHEEMAGAGGEKKLQTQPAAEATYLCCRRWTVSGPLLRHLLRKEDGRIKIFVSGQENH